MNDQEAKIIFRIDADLKKVFEAAAAAKDQTASQMLRAYVRYEVQNYIAKNQGDLFKEPATQPPKEVKKTHQKATPKPVEGKSALLDMFKPKR